MKNEKINYLECPSNDLKKTKLFFSEVFNASFVDYSSEYIAFNNMGIDGGFFKSDKVIDVNKGSVLIVFYSDDLEVIQQKIINAGGKISKKTFSFPGGQRFHFQDLTNNEYAVWSA